MYRPRTDDYRRSNTTPRTSNKRSPSRSSVHKSLLRRTTPTHLPASSPSPSSSRSHTPPRNPVKQIVDGRTTPVILKRPISTVPRPPVIQIPPPSPARPQFNSTTPKFTPKDTFPRSPTPTPPPHKRPTLHQSTSHKPLKSISPIPVSVSVYDETCQPLPPPGPGVLREYAIVTVLPGRDPSIDGEYSDEDWLLYEYSSSSEHSSDADDDSTSPSSSDWEESSPLSSTSPASRTPRPRPQTRKEGTTIPRAPSRTPLFPIATKSRKRASLKEAHRRRFGALFPLEKDSVEEKAALSEGGRLAGYTSLVTCKTDRSVPSRKKTSPSSSELRRSPSESTLTLSSGGTADSCSCSSSSGTTTTTSDSPSTPRTTTTTTSDSLSIFSPVPSISTTSTLCPSSTISPASTSSPQRPHHHHHNNTTHNHKKSTSRSTWPPYVYPPPPPSVPVDPCSCPLVLGMLETYIAETELASRMEEEELAREEEAFQRSLVLAREVEERRKGMMRSSSMPPSSRRRRKSHPWLLSVEHLSNEGREERMCTPSFEGDLKDEDEDEEDPVQIRVPPSKKSSLLRPQPITTAYGYRAQSGDVKAVFEWPCSQGGDQLPISTTRVAGERRGRGRRVPPSSVEFETYRTPQRPSRRASVKDVESTVAVSALWRRTKGESGTTTTTTNATRRDEDEFVHHHLSLDYEYYGTGMESEEEEEGEEEEVEEVLGQYTILTAPPRGRTSSRYPSQTLSPSLRSSSSTTSLSSSSTTTTSLTSSSSRTIPSPPPFTQLPTRKRSVADQRFYRVYALENSIRMRAGKNGVELEWYGSRSITMCKPLRVVCSTERSVSPLREE